MQESVTMLLSRASGGDRDAFDQLVPLVYTELHRMAQGYLRREQPDHTLQPTALVHEAYLKLVDYDGQQYKDTAHFYAIAANVMRRILVDHARMRNAAKRGSSVEIPWNDALDFSPECASIVVALNDALDGLALTDEKKARLIEMRFFGGMTAEQIAEREGIPVYTARRELRIAQAWLRREMGA